METLTVRNANLCAMLGVMRTAEKIQEWVKRRGLTQSAFERMVGLPGGRISRWLGGTGEPTGKQIFRISRALGLSMDYLLDESVTDPSPSANLNDDERTLIKIARIMEGGATEAIRRIMASAEPGDSFVPPLTKPVAPVEHPRALKPVAVTTRKLEAQPVRAHNRTAKAGKGNR